MFTKFKVNIPFGENLNQMSIYEKFKKYLLIEKRK